MTNDLLKRHPLPWRLHPDHPRPGLSATDEEGVILDAHGERVLWSSEWFGAQEGALEFIVETINATGGNNGSKN